jgi:hypothetical protein
VHIRKIQVGCSKRPSSKAAGESNPEAYPLGYVEDFDELRTPLAGVFSILLLEEGLLLLKPLHLTLQLLHPILQTGVVEPKQIQAIQELLPLNLRPLQRSFQSLQLKLDLLLFVNRE